ncbi:MAG: tagatose 1,6-diphosphate aldolase [Verrucomicrobia bacterium]|nr:tagatose 1,6-diphosphate aldolase [Verrucomicrobiota bacterium]
MKRLSLGKWRRLHQAASERGTFTVLAIDHRGPLRRALTRLAPSNDPDAALAELKEDIVRELAAQASAVLLDPEIGVPHCLRRAVLPGRAGLIVAQDTGSTGDPANVSTGLAPNWAVTDTARIGAAGAKLLVYYHPQAASAARVEQLVRGIADACVHEQLPLYLEPLSITPDSPATPLPSEARRRAVVETARRLVPLGVDVLKAEFPLKVTEQPDELAWEDACLELTEASAVPWVLLSGGVAWDVFLRQAEVACRSGASGVMAGRAFWNEAVTPDRTARRAFLAREATERFRRLRAICDTSARPFQHLLQPDARQPHRA